MDSFTSVLHPLTLWLHAHPHWAGFITFLISLSESLAIVGSIIPGSVTMTAIGMLIGTGVIPLVSTFVWAILGAIAGDSLSFFLGFYFKENLVNIWPFTRYPTMISKGRIFFDLHGGKSVFIGRFLGPLRSIVPVIAGIMGMGQVRFLAANITSAVLWSLLYILPGVLIGAATVELSGDLASKLFIFIIGGLVAIWLLSILIKYIWDKSHEFVDGHIEGMWHWLKSHHKLDVVAHFLMHPKKPDAHGQLALCFGSLLSLTLFCLFAYGAKHVELVSSVNHSVFYLLQSIRTPELDKFMLFLSLYSDKIVWLTVTLSLAGGVFVYGHKRLAVFLMANFAVISLFVHLSKHFIQSLRPSLFENIRPGFSFPSGHTSLSFAVLGFLSFIIAREFEEDIRRLIYLPILAFALLLAFSRLYLGVHWVSDIFGGIALAGTTLSLHLLLYRRKEQHALNPKRFIPPLVLVWLIAGSLFAWHNYEHEKKQTQIKHAKIHLSENVWFSEKNPLPLMRQDRLGHKSHPLNIQLLMDKETLLKDLEAIGFKTVEKRNLAIILSRLANMNHPHSLPVLPQLHKNKRPKVIVSRLKDPSMPIEVLRLWHADVTLKDSQFPLWLGSLSYRNPPQFHWQKKAPVILNVEKALAPLLKKTDYKTIKQGKVLLIKTKNY